MYRGEGPGGIPIRAGVGSEFEIYRFLHEAISESWQTFVIIVWGKHKTCGPTLRKVFTVLFEQPYGAQNKAVSPLR